MTFFFEVKHKHDDPVAIPDYVHVHSVITRSAKASINTHSRKPAKLPARGSCLFSWIKQVYDVNDKEMFRICDHDGYLYLYFLRSAAYFFALSN